MIRLFLLPCCCLFVTASFAQFGYTSPVLTPAAIAAPSYEVPAPVSASRLLSDQALSGPGYRVAQQADPSGMLYSFRINSNYGVFEPHSLQMMRVRLTELQAMNRLKELSEQPLFVQGMGQQLGRTVTATGKAIMSPIKTIKQMPVGFKKFAGDIQAQQAVGEVYGESGSGSYAQVKRELASRLKVDPYTDNQPLQDLLNEVAKNQNRGQLVASIGTLVVGGGAGLALGAVEMNDEFQAVIRNKSAAQLQVDNHTALLGMGCAVPSVDRFLNTPGYTASNCTAITRAIIEMRSVSNVCGVLDVLPPFAGPESILLAQTQIQMAAQFHRSQKALVKMQIVENTAVWSDSEGTSYVFSPLEYLYWNEEIDIGFSNIRSALGTGLLELWISGTATDAARGQLAGRGVAVEPESFGKLWPQAR